MVVDGALITDQQLVDTLTALEPVVRSMDEEADRNNYRHLTFFEITTAAAFYFFAKQNCDCVVLEVGLGGRLDSTNVCQPVTSIITNISIDHTRQLGATVDKIAFEKAGIIKPSVPIVSGATNAKAAEVIAKVAKERDAPLLVLGPDFDFEDTDVEAGFVFSVKGKFDLGRGVRTLAPKPPGSDQVPDLHPISYQIDKLKLGFLGLHQRVNAAVAVAAIQTLNARGWNISDEEIRTGLSRATLAGRTEVLSCSPAIVIDIAHNVASIGALIETLKSDFPQWQTVSRRNVILAISRDKDAVGMLRPLVENFDQIMLTRYQDNPRGMSEDELLSMATKIQSELRSTSQPAAELTTATNPDLAWEHVIGKLGNNDLLCITGSAFLVAELRKTAMVAFQSHP
jgi:dihydrofolate synthase/folylpolyglutamate synthase